MVFRQFFEVWKLGSKISQQPQLKIARSNRGYSALDTVLVIEKKLTI